MRQDLKAYFQQHPGFQQRAGIFFQNDLTSLSDFERPYLQLRQQEGRIYNDDLLMKLPAIPKGHTLQREWNIRHGSAKRLMVYLKKKKISRVVEIGCGNGWLLRYLHDALQIEGAGIDVNATELQQAARVFGKRRKLAFIYADILAEDFHEPFADIFVVASAIQYFPDLKFLLNKLLKLLLPSGEIHILDSPFYAKKGAALAKQRSDAYFRKAGSPAMTDLYFHHTWESIQHYNYHVLYDPTNLWNKIRRLTTADSPFPWIRIRVHELDR